MSEKVVERNETPLYAHYSLFSQVFWFFWYNLRKGGHKLELCNLNVSRSQGVPFINPIGTSLTIQCLCFLPQTVEEHMQLSFSHIMKHWKRNPNQPGVTKIPGSSRNVLLRFYPPQSALGKSQPLYKSILIIIIRLWLLI